MGLIIKPWIDNVGYYQCVLYKSSKRCYVRIHRLIAKAFVANTYSKKQVDHIDGNKLNNNINNLQWVTNSENVKRGYLNGGYLSKRHVLVTAIDKVTGIEQEFESIRSCSKALHINRKTLTSILKNGKSNNYRYEFIGRSVETIESGNSKQVS